jgi:hypothetical protein
MPEPFTIPSVIPTVPMLYAIVGAAQIDQGIHDSMLGRIDRVTPKVRLTTGHDSRSNLTPLEIKVRGIAFTVDVQMSAPRPIGWRPDTNDSWDLAWFRKTCGYTFGELPYGGGYRYVRDGKRLGTDSAANGKLDDMMYAAMEWLDANHFEWREQSRVMGWDSLIGHETYEIERMARRISEHEATIAQLIAKRDGRKR